MKLLKIGLLACALGLSAFVVNFSVAQDKGPSVGDTAPTFETVDEAGKPWNSKEHVGKKIVVVYFYPADFTGGCTKQACGFRDDSSKLIDLGVEVVGVSGDSAKTHADFKKEHKLTFTLLADEKGEVAKKFGVPFTAGPKTVKFKDVEYTRGGSASRITFVIGTDGKIVYRGAPKSAGDDSKTIITTVKELKK